MSKIKAIFLVAGHGLSGSGREDNGAVRGGVTERNVVTSITRALFKKLQPNGIDIISIGVDENLTLNRKVELVNETCKKNGYTTNNSILLSIHTNAGGGAGIESFTYKDWYAGLGYGNKILLRLHESTGMKIRGAKYESQSQYDELAIVHNTIPISILIECGFIDNEFDRNIMVQKEHKIVNGLYNGLADIVGFPKDTGQELVIENGILKTKLQKIKDFITNI